MIFTTWNFGTGYIGFRQGLPTFHGDGDIGRDAARQYATDIFLWCAATRDYPYTKHPLPHVPWPLHWCAAMEIRTNVIREFNRSNPNALITNPDF